MVKVEFQFTLNNESFEDRPYSMSLIRTRCTLVVLAAALIGLSPADLLAQPAETAPSNASPEASAAAPHDQPVLQGSALSVVTEVGGSAGAYTVGVEHLFVRTPRLQLGMQAGGAYEQNLFWDGDRAWAVSAGGTATRRIGNIGDQPVAVEAGLGATRVHSEFDSGSIISTTSFLPYLTGALRIEAAEGRLSYRLGLTVFSDDSTPLLLPILGVRVRIF